MTDMNETASGTEAEILFDADSGISAEEQREILAAINSIADQNRRALAEGIARGAATGAAEAGNRRRFKARKSGGLFPALVNAAAVALLAGGFLLLASFQGKTDAQARQGAKPYTGEEQALIGEIRKETSSRIEEKENEISLMASRLEAVDARLQTIHSRYDELTAEQQATENQLLALREEYRFSLAALRDERSRILEEAREREADLRSQIEARAKELDSLAAQNAALTAQGAALAAQNAALAEQSAASAAQSAANAAQSAAIISENAAALDNARAEIDRLSREREKSALVEAELGAFFVNLNTWIQAGRFAEAAVAARAMRDFLNTPAFQGLRSIQERKDMYSQAIDSVEALLEQTRKNEAALAAARKLPGAETGQALAALREQYAALEQTLEEQNRTIQAFSSEGSGLARRLSEIRGQADALRTLNTALKASADEKDKTISALQSEKAAFEQTLSGVRAESAAAVSAKDSEIATLRRDAERLEREKRELNQDIEAVRRLLNRQIPPQQADPAPAAGQQP
jgi:chromosome segregation ATPase